MKLCGIYKITSPSGGIYIGQSIDIKSRERSYKNIKLKSQFILYNSIKKYGWENHKLDVIHECLREELNQWEIYYIKQYDTFETKHGMNLTSGGGAATEYSKEARERMSLAQRSKILSAEHIENIRAAARLRIGTKASPETKEKIRQAQVGNKNCLGFKHSEERRVKIKLTFQNNPEIEVNRRKKISESKKGKNFEFYDRMVSKETRKKLSKSHKGENNFFFGQIHTQESKDKISKALKGKYRGENSPNYGNKHTEETKEKMRLAKLGKTHSEETRNKLSTSLRGKLSGDKNPNFGKSFSEETRRRMSEGQRKKAKPSKETCRKISEANKGKVFSEETRQRMREAQKKRFGKNNLDKVV